MGLTARVAVYAFIIYTNIILLSKENIYSTNEPVRICTPIAPERLQYIAIKNTNVRRVPKTAAQVAPTSVSFGENRPSECVNRSD